LAKFTAKIQTETPATVDEGHDANQFIDIFASSPQGWFTHPISKHDLTMSYFILEHKIIVL
jgi:hypothetical protein